MSEFGLLTTGGYANVYYSKSKQLVKKVQPSIVQTDEKHCILQYSSIVDLVTHASFETLPGVPVLLGHSVTQTSVKMYMPYYGRPLNKVVADWNMQHENNREVKILNILITLIETCMQLEHNGVQHTDIKPSNILISDFGQVTLIDFNIMSSIRCHNDHLEWEEAIGTWSYCAPEIIEHSAPSNTSTTWSLGLIMGYMFGSFPLLERRNMTDEQIASRDHWVGVFQRERAYNSEYLTLPPKHRSIMSSSLQYIYTQCTQWDPHARISLFELRSMVYLYMTHATPPPLFLHTITWHANPSHIPSDVRIEAIEIAFTLCKHTGAERMFVLIVSWIDRLPYDTVDTMDIAALFVLALMLLGNYVFDDKQLCACMIDELQLPNDLNLLMDHVIIIGQALQWKLWEKSTDVSLCEMGVENCVVRMKQVLLDREEPYTLAELAASTI